MLVVMEMMSQLLLEGTTEILSTTVLATSDRCQVLCVMNLKYRRARCTSGCCENTSGFGVDRLSH